MLVYVWDGCVLDFGPLITEVIGVVKGRAYQSGLALGLAIIEMVHLMYQNDTARRFYQGLFAVLRKEFKRRKVT